MACTEAAVGGTSNSSSADALSSRPPSLLGPCTLPASLTYSDMHGTPYGEGDLSCPLPILVAFMSYTTGLSSHVCDIITSPFPPPPMPGEWPPTSTAM